MTPANCDLYGRSFWARPDSVVDLYEVEDWNEVLPEEPDEYVFVCLDCERKYVFTE